MELKNIPHYELDGRIYFTKARFRDMAAKVVELPEPMEAAPVVKPAKAKVRSDDGYIKPMCWKGGQLRELNRWRREMGATIAGPGVAGRSINRTAR